MEKIIEISSVVGMIVFWAVISFIVIAIFAVAFCDKPVSCKNKVPDSDGYCQRNQQIKVIDHVAICVCNE